MKPSRAPGVTAIVVALVTATALPGCSRDEVAHYRVPKEPSFVPAAMDGGMPGGTGAPGGMGTGEVAPPPALTGHALAWTLPKGWTETRQGGMRYATIKPSQPGRLEVTVVVLPGPAGGELANVNRWRGQIGLPPVDEAALAAARRRITTRAGPVSLYEFESEGQVRSRVVAALASVEGNSWFVKMTGDAAPVGAARPDFVRLLESLRLEAKN